MSQNKIFAKNFSALKQCQPELATQIENTPDIPAFQFIQDQPNIEINFSDGAKKLYYEIDPATDAMQILQRLQLENPRIIVFLGFGLGHHVLQYIRKPHRLNQVIVIVEPYLQVFKMALHCHDMTALLTHAQVKFCVGMDEPKLKVYFGDLFKSTHLLRYANAIEYIPLPAAINHTSVFFKQVEQIIPQAIGHNYNLYFSDPYDGFRGTMNLIQNAPTLMQMPSLTLAKDLFKGKPGLIVASGPSLTESLPYLKEVQDRFVIVACPSALSVLKQNQIKAHVWVQIERQAYQAELFEPYQKEDDHIFVTIPLVHPACLAVGGPNKAYVLSTVQAQWLPFEDEALSFGHSSAHASFAILQLLGCDQIYLLGQDLCYAGEQSHAADIWLESVRSKENLKHESPKIFKVEGNSGAPVELNLFWFTYLKSFSEEMIPKYQGHVYNVIPQNAGAKIMGTERLDPQNLATSLKTESFDALKELRAKLKIPTTADIDRRSALLTERSQGAIKAFKRLAQDNEQFALEVKALQFSYEFATHDWQKAEPLYQKFLARIDEFFARIFNEASYAADRFHYEHLYFAIVQGLSLRYFIEYFTSAKDLAGEFSEINRKFEILYHLAKDHAFWARSLQALLEQSLKR